MLSFGFGGSSPSAPTNWSFGIAGAYVRLKSGRTRFDSSRLHDERDCRFESYLG